MDIEKSMELIDKPTFLGSLGLLLLVIVPLILFPEQGAVWVRAARDFLTGTLGVFYLALGLGALGFMIFISLSDIGSIHLGDPGDEPEFSTVSWAAMLFCAGIGSSIMYWSLVEWIYYYQAPPFHVEGMANEAARWAAAYGIFHWGPLAWSIYLIPALPIAYFYYVRKRPVLKISEALLPVIGDKHAHGPLGKLLDVLFVFGMLGGAATTLSLAAPMINEGAYQLFGMPRSITSQIIILAVCTVIFGYSAYSGLKKGIQVLSSINLWLALLLLGFVLAVGPTKFMIEAGFDALGRVLTHLVHMSTWIEPFGNFEGFEDTGFPQDWTIFYWAWWLAFAPSVGLFIARISRGRSIREMIIGSLIYGTFGCFLFFMVLGNYGIYLQLSGELDLVHILNNESPTAAIFATLRQLPMSTVVVALFTLLAVIFLSTTFDSISYILASVVQKEVPDEPLRWNRLFWACALSAMPVSLLILGGLDTLQTASIVGGAPLLPVAFLLCVSIVKVARYDMAHQPGFRPTRVHITEISGDDPWSEEGDWETPQDTESASAEGERSS